MSAISVTYPQRKPDDTVVVNRLRASSSNEIRLNFDEPPQWSRAHETSSLEVSGAVSRTWGREGGFHDDFGEIVEARFSRLRRLALKILRSEDLADDAVQEALLSLWREGRMPSQVDGWLVRAVVHRSLHLNRTRQRRRKHEEHACRTRNEWDAAWEPSRALEIAELAQRLSSALDRLPVHLRTVIQLREQEQMEYEAIAETLGVPVGTVRSRLSRARQALKDVLFGASAIG